MALILHEKQMETIGWLVGWSLTSLFSTNMAIMDLSKAMSQKWCKIGGILLLITNRKSYMSFRLVPKSMTLNDLERHNGPYFALFHQIR